MNKELVKAWEPMLVRCRRRGMRRFVLKGGVARWESMSGSCRVWGEVTFSDTLSDHLQVLLMLKKEFQVPSPGMGVVLATQKLFPGEVVERGLWGRVGDEFGMEEVDLLERGVLWWVAAVAAVVGVIVTLIRVVQLCLNWT